MLPTSFNFIEPRDTVSIFRKSKTFKLDHEKGRVISEYIDGQEAIAQAIWINLGIEKGVWDIQTSEYGVEFAKYYGKDRDLAKAQLEMVIKRALSWDERIFDTYDYQFTDVGSESINIDFNVSTSAGVFRTGITVNV